MSQHKVVTDREIDLILKHYARYQESILYRLAADLKQEREKQTRVFTPLMDQVL